MLSERRPFDRPSELDRYCSWILCANCGSQVFMGEPVGTEVASIECHAPLHITRLTEPPTPVRSIVQIVAGWLGWSNAEAR